MTRSATLVLSLSFLAALQLGGCGDDGGPNVTISDSGPEFDAAPPDAGAPDAFVCTLTECGSACVDTTTDSLNCGGCGLACDSPGQICSGALPCACPDPFVPATIGGGGDQVFMQSGAYLAIAPLGFGPLNVVIVVYDLELLIDNDYDLSESLTNVAPPSVALGYDVNIGDQSAKAAYAATEGTLRFDTICDTGASGTITGATFAEVEGTLNPTIIEGGCSQSYETLSFDIGSCPNP